MAEITQGIFDGVPKKMVSLGRVGRSAGLSEVLSRPLAWGPQWSVIRMGMLCSVGDFPDQPYSRSFGFYWGVSSGSRTVFDTAETDRTCVGVSLGPVHWSYFNRGFFYPSFVEHTSGSYFSIADVSLTAMSASSNVTHGRVNGLTVYNGVSVFNSGDQIKRRSIFMLEISASPSFGGTVDTNMYSIGEVGINQYDGNKDYTDGDLKAILTSSIPPTASGVPMLRFTDHVRGFSTSSYPLDTVFVGIEGGIPLEIYNWYIYKVK